MLYIISQYRSCAEVSILLANSQEGNGGKVIIFSNKDTEFHGLIEAKGKKKGGLAEVSGLKNLIITGYANLKGTEGEDGLLLTDPGNVTIDSGNQAGTNTYGTTWVNTQLGFSSLTISTTNSTSGEADQILTLESGATISWTSDNTLSLIADVININGTISHLVGTGHLNLRPNISDIDDASHKVTIGSNGLIDFEGGDQKFRLIRIFHNSTDNAATKTATILGTVNIETWFQTGIASYEYITNKAEFDAMSLTGDYAMKNDIALSGTHTPKGSLGSAFQGGFTGDNLNGGRFKISDLEIGTAGVPIADNRDYQGLFGVIGDQAPSPKIYGYIDNIELSNVEINLTGDSDYVGALAGTVDGVSYVSNVDVTSGTVKGNDYTGGLIGDILYASEVKYCSSSTNLTSTGNYSGVLIGRVQSSSVLVDRCHATGTLSGVYEGAGFVGRNSGTITYSYATGNVSLSGNHYAGGFVGRSYGTITDCYSTGDVSNANKDAGGFAGTLYTGSTTARCFSTGNVTHTGAAAEIGGFAGEIGDTGTTITDCYSIGNVTAAGASLAGGFVGNILDANPIITKGLS